MISAVSGEEALILLALLSKNLPFESLQTTALPTTSSCGLIAASILNLIRPTREGLHFEAGKL
ncbi:conserved hypothetical protein [Ricinus communis]|uniref:Uncharacterized protein n=1 Tax=Ricinus communis TaxID=3988 RepID=B9SB91_RICCO|nr:conserved hypothetical protein [Ricinus communis]